MVQLTDIADTPQCQFKQIHFMFPNRADRHSGTCQFFCNDKYWGNKNHCIESVPMCCSSKFQVDNDTTNYFIRWAFTVESGKPNVVKKTKAMTTKEKLVARLQNKGKASNPSGTLLAPMNTQP